MPSSSPSRDLPSRDLANALTMAAIRLTRTLRALTKRSGLSGPEISALAVINYSGRIAAKHLAALEEVTPATISRLVAAMEEKGLVKRTRDGADTRLQWISMTKTGRRLVEDGHEMRIAPLARALAALPKDKARKLEEAAAILEEVVADVARSAVKRPPSD